MNMAITQAEYLWLDGAAPGQRLRSKSRIVALPEKEPGLETFSTLRAVGRTWVGLLLTMAAAVSSVAVAAPAHAWQGDQIQNWESHQCLDADRNRWWLPDPHPPVEIQSWQCINGQSNQQWWHNWGTSTIQTPGPNPYPDLAGPAKCLDAWEVIPGYIDIRLWSCNGGKQQGWIFHRVWANGHMIESEKYRGWCLRWWANYPPIGVGSCDPNDDTRLWFISRLY
jgi:hypothetical protein